MRECTITTGACTITFNSNLSTNVCYGMETELLDKVKSMKCEKIVFDLKHVEYIASAFIRICLTTAELSNYQNFSIINTTPFIKKVFKIAGIDKKLNVT